jgi:hypothetical protein
MTAPFNTIRCLKPRQAKNGLEYFGIGFEKDSHESDAVKLIPTHPVVIWFCLDLSVQHRNQLRLYPKSYLRLKTVYHVLNGDWTK